MKGEPVFSHEEEITSWREERRERDRGLWGQSGRGWASSLVERQRESSKAAVWGKVRFLIL